MANLLIRPDGYLPERAATPEAVFLNRRRFLKASGLAVAAGWSGGALTGCNGHEEPAAQAPPPATAVKDATPAKNATAGAYPARRNPGFDPGAQVTDEKVATHYNNFYEFTLDKQGVARLAQRMVTTPWPVEVSGLVEKPLTLDAQEWLALAPLEERVYRFRCVEAWSMVVPWTGFPLARLIEKVQPKPEAKFIRFETFGMKDWAPGMRDASYPWPYFEGLRMDEAMHPLTLLTGGIYGKPLPNQHGAPLRIVVPWKYGYKSIKSIVKIQFVATQPKTFWETLLPREYPFESNVNPAVPHPRWSQATERVIDTGDRVKTQLYNGYGNQVAKLYS